MSSLDIDKFVQGYLVCALWSSTADDGRPMDDLFRLSDYSADALRSAREDCESFVDHAETLLLRAFTLRESYGSVCAGHDFWLTRNGHGAGFWDRGLGEVGEALSTAARAHGECYLYASDKGKLHFQ